MTDDKKEMKQTNATYLGKELVKKGVSSNGKEWVMFKVKFEYVNEDGQTRNINSNVFSNFGVKKDGTSYCKTLKDLEEGEEYNVQYQEEPFIAEGGAERIAKKVQFIHSKKESVADKVNAATKDTAPDTNNIRTKQLVITPKNIEYATKYKDAMIKAGKEININHFMGYFCRGNKADVGSEFVDWLELLFNEHVK